MKTINKTCKICGNIFIANTNRAAFCSLECKKTAKKLNDKKYRESEHGAAVRRKNRKNASAHVATIDEVKELFSANACFYCNKELSEQEKTVDHKIPVSKCGTNAKTNLVICCRHCNSLKNDKEVI